MRHSPRWACISARTFPLITLLALVVTVTVAAVALPSTAQAAHPHRKALAATSVTGWSAAPTSVATETAYVVRVRVSGRSRTVQLQRRTGSAWRTVAAARSNRSGAATLTWRAPATATTVALRARVLRTARRAGAVTPSRVVRVVTPSTPSSPTDPTDPTTPTDPTPPAAPVLAPELEEVLTLVNQARASGHSCGGVSYPAVGALTADTRLVAAADTFAELMGTQGFFSHTSPDGSSAGDRIRAAGYDWRTYGENIAAGQTTAAAVVATWLASTDHCKSIMSGSFREIGLGHAVVDGSPFGTYWVQVFAAR